MTSRRSQGRIIGYVCVDETGDIWRALVRSEWGLDHIAYEKGDEYGVIADEVMRGYQDDGPECSTCEVEIKGETYIDYYGEVYCLACLAEAGLWREVEES